MDVYTRDTVKTSDLDVEVQDDDKLSEIIDNFLQLSVREEDETSYHFRNKSTVSLTDIFKTVHYPINFSVDHTNERYSGVLSLRDMCLVKVIRNAMKFRSRKRIVLPKGLHHLLVREAMTRDFQQFVIFLMASWPFKTMTVAKVVRKISSVALILVNEERRLKYLSNEAKKFIRCLMIFLYLIKNLSMTRLRVLDLRGMPMTDRVMNYLCRELIFLSDDVLPTDDYHVVIDCAICTNDTFNLLMSLLKIMDLQKTKPQLHINKLDVSYLIPYKSVQILQRINPYELVGLSTQIDIGTNLHWIISSRFPNLKSLEIFDRGQPPAIFPDQFLPLRCRSHLRRLALHCRLYQLFDIVPSYIAGGLEFLDVSDPYVLIPNEVDLQYLNSIPFQCLRELNLAGFAFADLHVNLWCDLFDALAPTLRILQWGFCITAQPQFYQLVDCILPLRNLVYLNLNSNNIRMRTLSDNAPKLSAMGKLRYIRLPYIDENSVRVCVADEISAKIWKKIIQQQFETAKTPPAYILWEMYKPFRL